MVEFNKSNYLSSILEKGKALNDMITSTEGSEPNSEEYEIHPDLGGFDMEENIGKLV